MDVIPVIDIMNGVAVHAVGGHRNCYKPVKSVLTESRDPSVLIRQFQMLGLTEAYVADLDAILQQQPNRCTLVELARCGSRIIADYGIHSVDAATEAADLDLGANVIALETLPSLEQLQEVVQPLAGGRVVFSLDLVDGIVSSQNPKDVRRSPLDIVQRVLDCGVTDFIVLDLRSVGIDEGPCTIDLCSRIRSEYPGVERLITGGGFREIGHFAAARDTGVDGVLVASALHNGRLDYDTLQELKSL